MRAGRMNVFGMVQRILEEPQSDFGDPQPEWTTYTTAWAAIEPGPGTEENRGDRVEATVAYQILLRYGDGGITPKMRFLAAESGRIFQFIEVNNTRERGFQYKIRAVEVITPPEVES